jgi:autotransporter-associated beta strand protein
MVQKHVSLRLFSSIAAMAACLLALSGNVQAGSAQWNGASTSNDWNAGANWTPNVAPNGLSDVATFDVTNQADLSFSAVTAVGSITFNSGASDYTITANRNFPLTISGAGIINNSGRMQNFVAAADNSSNLGPIIFTNNSAAGSLITFTTRAGTVLGDGGSTLWFRDTSTADHATIVNGADGAGYSSITQFSNSASAGDATVTNNGGSFYGSVGAGNTTFEDSSTAANGSFTTNGGTAQYTQGGQTSFFGYATAANGTFISNGALSTNSWGGFTTFQGFTTAGHGTFTINGGTVSGAEAGRVWFRDSSTAANGVFVVNGGSVAGAAGGQIAFDPGTSAGSGNFTFNGGAPGAQGAWVYLQGGSAGSATFITNGGSEGGSSGALFQLGGTDGATASVTTNGGTAMGAAGGVTDFGGSGNAAHALLTVNPGSAGGAAGKIIFSGYATGGAARLILNGDAILDVTPHATGYAVAIGSIEGTGTILLGDKELTVGTDNRNITFNGLIQDGPLSGARGSLNKVGTGTLILPNANSYRGTTTVGAGILVLNNSNNESAIVVNGGTLILNGSSASATATVNGGTFIVNGSTPADVTLNAGTLSGIGNIGSATVNKGGTLTPGNNTPGSLSMAGNLTLSKGSTYIVSLTATQSSETNVGGSVTLNNAKLSLSFNFMPSPGATFTIINNAGSSPISGTFSGLRSNAKVKIGKHTFKISYTGGDGNDVVLSVVK